MKKTMFALASAFALTASPFLASTADAAESPSMIITDGSVVIDWPSNYAGQGYSIEDGNRQYKSGVLDSNGDARFDLKTGKSFRTYAPDSVFVNIQGFTGWKGYARNTTLKKEESGFRLMFKEQYNATENFRLNANDVFYSGSVLDIDIEQTSTIKRTVLYTDEYRDETLGFNVVDVEVAPSTQATFSGTSYPVYASGTSEEISGDPSTEMTYHLPFIFDGKSYPGIVLR